MGSELVRPHVFIREFDDSSISKVIEQLEKIESHYNSSQPVIIQIDSYGGPIKGLSVVYDKVKSMSHPIFTYTASNAMSAGAIALATMAPAGQRYASPEATVMVHEVQAGAIGDIKDIEDQFNYLKVVNKKWMFILAKSMGLKSHSSIRNLIKKKAIGQDIFLSAAQAQKLGIIDEVASLTVSPLQLWEIKKTRK